MIQMTNLVGSIHMDDKPTSWLHVQSKDSEAILQHMWVAIDLC